MRLWILLVLLITIALNSWALVVVTEPYSGLDNEITAYDLHRESDLDNCECPQYGNPYRLEIYD